MAKKAKPSKSASATATAAPENRIKEVTYQITPNSPFSSKKGKIYGQALAEIMKIEDVDSLTPELVVKHAKDPASPIHEVFEWDEQAAAEKFWLVQARKLLNHIKVTVVYLDRHDIERTVTVKGFVNLQSEEPGERHQRRYFPAAAVLTSPSMRQQAFDQFMAQADRFVEIAKTFQDMEFLAVVGELETVMTKMRGFFRRRV